MTQPIDTAYVDIVVRDKSLDKLRKDIDKTFDDIDRDIEKSLTDIDQSFDDTFVEIDEHFKKMSVRSKKAFTDVGDDAESTFKRIRRKFQEPLERGFTRLSELVSDAGRLIGQLGSSIAGFVTSSPLLALIIALTPAIIALAGALTQLIGLVGILPAGFGVLIAAIVPVVVAFQNFGDAVSALAEGDVEKIDEALKKLSGSARIMAREVAAALPFLRSFQRSIQESFFAPLTGSFTKLVSILPAIRGNIGAVATSMALLAKSFVAMLASPDTIATLNGLFATTARIITNITAPFTRFTDMLFNVVGAGLPFVERLGAAFGRVLDRFSTFVNTSIENGSFNQFVEDAITTVKELIDLVKAAGGLLGTLFAGTEDSGHDFIQSLTEMITRLDEFFQTAEGKNVIDAMVFSVKLLAVTLSTAIEIIIFSIKSVKNMLTVFEAIGRGVVGFVVMIGDWLGKVPGYITTFLGELPTLVAGLVNQMIDNALTALGLGIGLILFQIQVVPRQILSFLESLPQRIYAIFLEIGPLIGLAIQGAVDFGRNLIVNGFNEIVNFVLSVPDRLKALIPSFGSAGKNLIESFMNGFRSVGHFVGEIAGDIVNSVKSFLNRAIDKINSGIATIDAILPGDLGRIPRLASGAFVPRRPGGVPAIIGEGPEDEWVLPQSKLDALVGGTSITFGPGSINVNFSGAQLPTKSEAMSIGETIGQGLANAIARRDLRAQVRAI